MISSLFDLIAEQKDIADKGFKSYECLFVIKCLKEYNKKFIIDRIRGIQNVTIVETVDSSKMVRYNKKGGKYEYSLIRVKFITNKSPEDEIDNISFAMVKHNDEVKNIIGLVSAKPKLDTLNKVD